MTKAGKTVIDDLEQWVKEQAPIYGEVISYVPSKMPAAKTHATAPETPAATPTALPVVHHGFAELNAKLEGFREEGWTETDSLVKFESLIQDCKKCPLNETRTRLVFGKGNPNAKLMVIGEAPGADEDQAGEPFIGRAGQLLTKMLTAIQFERSDIYITNILKSRPPNNRDPQPLEVEKCEPYLWKQILMIEPKLILCLGRIAGTNLLKLYGSTLAKMRDQVFDFHGIKVVVTYHPAALLRNPDWKQGAWKDLQRLRELYDELPA